MANFPALVWCVALQNVVDNIYSEVLGIGNLQNNGSEKFTASCAAGAPMSLAASLSFPLF